MPDGFDRRIGVWDVAAPAPPTDGSKAKLKVKVRLNLHGVVAVESVYQVQEDEYEETVKKAPKVGPSTLGFVSWLALVGEAVLYCFLSCPQGMWEVAAPAAVSLTGTVLSSFLLSSSLRPITEEEPVADAGAPAADEKLGGRAV